MRSMVGQNFRTSSIIKKYVILVESNNNLQIQHFLFSNIPSHRNDRFLWKLSLSKIAGNRCLIDRRKKIERDREREREREEEDGRLSRAHAEIDARSRTNTKAKECHSRRLGRFPTLPSGIP